MLTRTFASQCLLVLLVADFATAGDYVLALGKGIEVCEAYLKNLNSFPKEPPMLCERKLNPKYAAFQKPRWEALDAQNNLDLIKQLYRSMHQESEAEFERNFQRWLPSFKERIERGLLELSVAKLDVDNDGRLVDVLRFYDGDCDLTQVSFTRLIRVLNADLTQIDVEKTKSISVGNKSDLFIYKDRLYIDTWYGGFADGQISVYTPLCTAGSDVQRCDYKYNESPKRSPQ